MLGNISVEVSFASDTNNKLACYSFEITKNIDGIDSSWLQEQLEYITGVFTNKYGNADKCTDYSLDIYSSQINSCSWHIGDYGLSTFYSNKNGQGTVKGQVCSLTRIFQTANKYNFKIKQLENDYERTIEEHKTDVLKEGASSY